MKKIFLAFTMTILTLSLFAACDKDDKVVGLNETPEKLQVFLNTHFNGVDVVYVEKEWNNYDVYLKNGFDLEFSKSGDLTEVDCNRNDMPQSIIDLLPAKVMEYVNANHKDRSIESINFRSNGYKVELKGEPDIEMYFDKDGNFKRNDY